MANPHREIKPVTQLQQSGPYILSAVENLVLDERIMLHRIVVDPITGRELACFTLSKNGFILFDPYDFSFRHIEHDKRSNGTWGAAQSAQGDIYHVDINQGRSLIYRWDFRSEKSTSLGLSPVHTCFYFDADGNDLLYLGNYEDHTIVVYDTRDGSSRILCDLAPLGHHVHPLYLGKDGMLYCIGIGYQNQERKGHFLIMVDPATGKVSDLSGLTGGPLAEYSFCRAGDGRILIGQKQKTGSQASVLEQPVECMIWRELINGEAVMIDHADVKVTTNNSPLVFSDGTRIDKFVEWECTVTSPDGKITTVDITPGLVPIRIFSVASGVGKVWAGTFIPLKLGSYDPATGEGVNYGNPTPVTGEIYTMTVSNEKLFCGSYTDAWITRYDPAKPTIPDGQEGANPANLGKMKEGPLALHRVYGVTQDNACNVYFSALGGYGCPDSGITRIDPKTEELTRWIYPQTTFGPLIYLPGEHQILVSERRQNESGVRFTLVNPDTGEITWTDILIVDEGNITAWVLTPDGKSIIGLHAYRATLLNYDIKSRKITHAIRELNMGAHCHNSLIPGFDGRLWGYTATSVFAVDWALTKAEPILRDWPDTSPNAYRFGICYGPDGALYFPDGDRLMKVTKAV